MPTDTLILSLRFWGGGSGKSYVCRGTCGIRRTHTYVDEVENYEWRLHGNLIAHVSGNKLILDACKHHTKLTLSRLYVVVRYGPLERLYTVEEDGVLCLVKLTYYPRQCYPLTSPVVVDLTSGEVVEGPRLVYSIPYTVFRPDRRKVSLHRFLSGRYVFVKTTADVDVVRRLTGLHSVYSGRVTVAVNADTGDVYLRPAGHKLNWWYKLSKDESRILFESINERDRWMFEDLESNPENIMKAWHVYLLAS